MLTVNQRVLLAQQITETPPSFVPELPNGRGQSGTCDPLNLGVCLNLLSLVDVELGNVPTKPCCSLIEGLVDLEAAACLCTAVRANVLGININLPITLNLFLNNCGRRVPTEYICNLL
ncbi:hypothetical protein V6N13_037999 [Hibiscus sabdariffa]|uniref:Hydrophobic seed protein domain-containing protein n=1 Tax=Hibiscus sabdariffa TaxID=183260 RepID=A0ABR2S3E7_9ROSI